MRETSTLETACFLSLTKSVYKVIIFEAQSFTHIFISSPIYVALPPLLPIFFSPSLLPNFYSVLSPLLLFFPTSILYGHPSFYSSQLQFCTVSPPSLLSNFYSVLSFLLLFFPTFYLYLLLLLQPLFYTFSPPSDPSSPNFCVALTYMYLSFSFLLFIKPLFSTFSLHFSQSLYFLPSSISETLLFFLFLPTPIFVSFLPPSLFSNFYFFEFSPFLFLTYVTFKLLLYLLNPKFLNLFSSFYSFKPLISKPLHPRLFLQTLNFWTSSPPSILSNP